MSCLLKFLEFPWFPVIILISLVITFQISTSLHSKREAALQACTSISILFFSSYVALVLGNFCNLVIFVSWMSTFLPFFFLLTVLIVGVWLIHYWCESLSMDSHCSRSSDGQPWLLPLRHDCMGQFGARSMGHIFSPRMRQLLQCGASSSLANITHKNVTQQCQAPETFKTEGLSVEEKHWEVLK